MGTNSQEEVDGIVRYLLQLLNPSPQCEGDFKNTLCAIVFGLCDDDSELRSLDGETCANTRDSVCAAEWQTILQMFGDDAFPICEELPVSTKECIGGLWNYRDTNQIQKGC